MVFLSNHEGETSNFVKKTVVDIKRSHPNDIADGLLQVGLCRKWGGNAQTIRVGLLGRP